MTASAKLRPYGDSEDRTGYGTDPASAHRALA